MLLLESVRSRVRVRIELGPRSSKVVQLVPPLIVRQMPPLTVPIHIRLALAGSVTTTCLFGMPSSCPPVITIGPWATKFGAPNGVARVAV